MNNYGLPPPSPSTSLSYPPSSVETDSSTNSQEASTPDDSNRLEAFIRHSNSDGAVEQSNSTQNANAIVDNTENRRKTFSIRSKSLGQKATTDKINQYKTDSGSIPEKTLSKPPSSTSPQKKTTFAKKLSGFSPIKFSLDSIDEKSKKTSVKSEITFEVRSYLTLLEKVKPGNLQIFFQGDTITRKLEEIEFSEIQKELKLEAEKSDAYKIYLKMSDFAEKLKKEKSSKDLLSYLFPEKIFKDKKKLKKSFAVNHIMTEQQKNFDNAMTEIAIFFSKKNSSSSTHLKNVLTREVYIQALLKQALEECAHISQQLTENEKLDCSNPKICFLKDINAHTSLLFQCASRAETPSHLEDYKKIFFIFTNAIKSFSKPEDTTLKAIPAFSTSAIRCFLYFFEKEVLKLQTIYYQNQHNIYTSLKDKFLTLKHINIIGKDLKTNIDVKPIIDLIEIGINSLSKNKFDPKLHLIQQIIQELNQIDEIKHIKKEDPIKRRLDSLTQVLNFKLKDSASTTEEESTSPHEYDKTSKRKSLSMNSFKLNSKSTLKQSEFSRENSSSSSHSTPRSSSLLPIDNNFLPKLMLDPSIQNFVKEKILNVFEFFIKNDPKKTPLGNII